MTAFTAKSAHCVLPVSIDAPANEVFPLASPIEEYKWIPGWKCDLQHCPNDTVELGVVFGEIFSAPFLVGNISGVTTWTTVFYDPEDYCIHFRLENKHSTSVYKIEFEDNGERNTGGKLDFTYTAKTPKGNRLVENGVETKLNIMLTVLRAELKYYAENKALIPASEVRKLIPMEKLSLADKILLLLNRSAKKSFVDNDRDRFLEMWTGEGQSK